MCYERRHRKGHKNSDRYVSIKFVEIELEFSNNVRHEGMVSLLHARLEGEWG